MFLDACYFCSSPFTIMNAISLVTANKEEADLYIQPDFNNVEAYVQAIETLGVFNQVKVIDLGVYQKYWKPGNWIFVHYELIKIYAFPKKMASDILIENRNYNKIYITNKNFLCRVMSLYLCRINKNLEIVGYEEGDASYFEETSQKQKFFDRFVRAIFYGKRALSVSCLFLYSELLYKKMNPKSTLRIKQIQFDSETITRLMQILYQEDSNYCIPEKAIILDTHKSLIFDESGIEKLNNLYKKIIQSLGTQNVAIKNHHRDTSPINPQWNYCKKSLAPFEIIGNNSGMNNKLIITYISSAAINVKTVLNEEPYIIFLYKLVSLKPGFNEMNLKRIQDLCTNLSDIYENKNRIFIPNTLDELESIIQYLINNL